MKAKLSLKGILNQWHLNCLCCDRSQKSRTPSNMLARILQFCDFLSRVNNAICKEIFIHWQSKGKFMPLVTNIQCIYFLSAFSPTLWINVPQSRRWNMTSSFSINLLHLVYPSLKPQYFNVNLLKASIFCLIQGYPPLKNKAKHGSKEFVFPLCLRKSLWIFAQIKDVALVLNMSVYWQHSHSKGRLLEMIDYRLKREHFCFNSAVQKKTWLTEWLKGDFPTSSCQLSETEGTK